ncbi:MAG: KR domain-containing protein, partial [Desulfamplus sp.]|nr:KR domain-containing protein [Desulfamplus sp.]
VVKKYQTNLIIVGRSSIYNIDELIDIKSLDTVDEQSIMASLRQTMQGAKPVEMKQAANKILSAIESRKNIEILQSFGVLVSYIAADVSNRDGLILALANVERVDGVIHAAGLEESMQFDKKSVESFDRVFNTKVYGCLNLIEALKDKAVKYYIGFSSVTAKFGNEGQTDYTAANEMMASILLNLKGCNSKVIDWTAWSGAGMATRETVQKVLSERGLKFLPLEAGVKFFIDEIEDATTPEVVITGLDHSFDRDGILKIAPFLDTISSISVKNGLQEVKFSRTLKIERDRFLLDHAMEGTPIFLGATGVETMAEAVLAAHSLDHQLDHQKDRLEQNLADQKGKIGNNIRVVEIKNFSIPYGIKLLQNKPKDITISVTGSHCQITSQFINSAGVAMGEPKLHYLSDVIIGNRDGSVKKMEIEQLLKSKVNIFNGKELDRQFTKLIYHPQRLFMEGVFRTIEEIISFDGKKLITKMADKSRDSFFVDDPCPMFLTDVVMLDAMFQTGGVFEFLTDSFIVLPYKIKSLKFFERAVKDREYFCITTKVTSDSETDTFNIDLVDQSGIYLMELVGFEMVKLNRLPDGMKIIES